MVLDRLIADVQGMADLFVALPLCDVLEQLEEWNGKAT